MSIKTWWRAQGPKRQVGIVVAAAAGWWVVAWLGDSGDGSKLGMRLAAQMRDAPQASQSSTQAEAQAAESASRSDRSNHEKASKASQRGDYAAALTAAYNVSPFYARYDEVKRIIAKNQARKREMERIVLRALRRAYPKQLEAAMLDQGLDVTAAVKGQDYTTITVKTMWSSRVFAHRLSKSSLIEGLDKMGFKRIEISGGLDEMVWTTSWQ